MMIVLVETVYIRPAATFQFICLVHQLLWCVEWEEKTPSKYIWNGDKHEFDFKIFADTKNKLKITLLLERNAIIRATIDQLLDSSFSLVFFHIYCVCEQELRTFLFF